MPSQLLFILICAIALALLTLASKMNKRLILLCGIVVLSLVAGCRATDVGIDTQFYYDAFVSDFRLRPWQFKDEGFRLLARVFMGVFHSPELVFFVVSLFTNALILLRLWDFKEKASFPFMAFLYITLFYIGTMNTMRQYLAVAVLFFATRYLEKRRYGVFLAALVLATSIHTTAIMGIAFLFVYLWVNAERKQRVYIGIAALLVVPAAFVGITLYESGHIENYFSNNIQNTNITFLYRVGSFVLACLLMSITNSHDEALREESKKTPAAFITFLSLLASSAGMYFSYLDRLGYYFASFEFIFWGMAVKRREWGWLFVLMASVYALYSFGYEIIYNGSGIFPFHFFFN